MDTISEEIIKKRIEASDIIKGVGIAFAALVLITAVTLIFSMFSFLSYLTFFAYAIIIYFAIRMILDLSIEYEYCFVNGELAIDKIIAKRKRISVCNIKIREIEAFGKYDAAKFEYRRFDSIFSSAKSTLSSNAWYAEYNSPESGKTLVIFEPSEKLLKNIEKYLKGTVRLEAFKNI